MLANIRRFPDRAKEKILQSYGVYESGSNYVFGQRRRNFYSLFSSSDRLLLSKRHVNTLLQKALDAFVAEEGSSQYSSMVHDRLFEYQIDDVVVELDYLKSGTTNHKSLTLRIGKQRKWYIEVMFDPNAVFGHVLTPPSLLTPEQLEESDLENWPPTNKSHALFIAGVEVPYDKLYTMPPKFQIIVRDLYLLYKLQ